MGHYLCVMMGISALRLHLQSRFISHHHRNDGKRILILESFLNHPCFLRASLPSRQLLRQSCSSLQQCLLWDGTCVCHKQPGLCWGFAQTHHKGLGKGAGFFSRPGANQTSFPRSITEFWLLLWARRSSGPPSPSSFSKMQPRLGQKSPNDSITNGNILTGGCKKGGSKAELLFRFYS